MQLIRASERVSSGSKPPPGGRFHGGVLQQALHESGAARASFIQFEPGAHTMWHTHSGGQVLHIVDGSARVRPWGDKTHELAAGDTAIAPPGEKHWHGADVDVAMTLLSITSGEVTWLEDVED